jgi:hypothetical protein
MPSLDFVFFFLDQNYFALNRHSLFFKKEIGGLGRETEVNIFLFQKKLLIQIKLGPNFALKCPLTRFAMLEIFVKTCIGLS